MPQTPTQQLEGATWNVLTSPWLDVVKRDGSTCLYSPLEALRQSNSIRCIAAASPLDYFAAHRFLVTLLYWKADEVGGVETVRDFLLRGEMPESMLQAIESASDCFHLFDDELPFLQDPESYSDKKSDWKSAGSMCAEFACGTNIAHFHHGDDLGMRLCLPCATVGLMRVIPWTQSGGAGLSPAIHNAPPIMALAVGKNLAETLGLNLVPIPGSPGDARWTGHFVPTDRLGAIQYLEAFTWNPRRIHLRSPSAGQECWRCGNRGLVAVGPIVFDKNTETRSNKNGRDTIPFAWQDPSAFYRPDEPYITLKSSFEQAAADGSDLSTLRQVDNPPSAFVVSANASHDNWTLIVPCTNPANNKTYDHRTLSISKSWSDALQCMKFAAKAEVRQNGVDGWSLPGRPIPHEGAACFVHAACRLLSNADWSELSTAAFRQMHESPAAFDLLTGLHWPLRRSVSALPSRNVAWLVLKLMASVASIARFPHSGGFSPLRELPKRQPVENRKGRAAKSVYPRALPRGHALEAALRGTLARNSRERIPRPIDWASLCYDLNQLVD